MNILPESKMWVGLLKLDLFFPHSHSLKEKRKILRQIKDKVWAKYKVSVHEVNFHDKWQRATLGVALVNCETQMIESLLNQVMDYIDNLCLGEVIDSISEIINF